MKDDNVIYYIRSNKELIGFKYNDDIYYYIKNNQDDIIRILDNECNVVAKYTYDSWGNIISITDGNDNDVSNNNTHIANINPYRYRSYYYDRETKLYYLNSRYYNPEWSRFINVDGIISSGDTIEGNLYNYCSNDPVNKVDSSGQFSIKKAWNWVKDKVKKVANTIKNVISKVISTKDVSTKDAYLPGGLNLGVASIRKFNTIATTKSKIGSDDSLLKFTTFSPEKIFDLKNLKINFPTSELSTNNGRFDIGLETGDGWAINVSWKKDEGYGNFSLGITTFGRIFFDLGESSEEESRVQTFYHNNIGINTVVLALAYAYSTETSLSALLKTIFSNPVRVYN